MQRLNTSLRRVSRLNLRSLARSAIAGPMIFKTSVKWVCRATVRPLKRKCSAVVIEKGCNQMFLRPVAVSAEEVRQRFY